MINVLVVDDSETSRQLLTAMINSTSDMRVVGQAYDGLRGVELAERLKPDVILMDITMPKMDGLEATYEIMATTPTPIVIISASIAGRETEIAFQALRQGALTVLNKPVGPMDPEFPVQADQILRTLRAMSSVHVIHHRADKARHKKSKEPTALDIITPSNKPELVALAASTGGPAALAQILQQLPADFALPIVIVQHIAADFLESLVKWMNSLTALEVKVAQIGDEPQPGNIYFAPVGEHLYFSAHREFATRTTPNHYYHVPSANVLFESTAAIYGKSGIGVMLTGMGDDGVDGLSTLYDTGAVTIAQNQATSAVFGMPGEAVARGIIQHTVPLSEIASLLYSLQKNEEKYNG